MNEPNENLRNNLIELETEWERRLQMDAEEYKLWLPDFHEEVVNERGGVFALLFAYCNLDEDNDPANGKYRCLYPLVPIPHGGVALVTRDAETLEREVKRFLSEMRFQRFN